MFVLLGISAMAALAAAAHLEPEVLPTVCLICAGLGLCALLAVILFGRKGKLSDFAGPGAFSVLWALRALPAMLLTAALCLFLYHSAWSREIAPGAALDGTEVRVRAVVLDYPERMYHKNYYKLRVTDVTVNGEPVKLNDFTARVSSWQDLDCEPYDTVECTVRLGAFADDGKLFSVRNTRWADGIAVGGYLSDYGEIEVIANTGSPPGELAARLRRLIGRGFERELPRREAALLRAMLLGEQYLVYGRDWNDFQRVGTVHLLAVSGMHISVLVTLLMLLLGRLPLGKLLRNLLTGLFIVFFVVLIGAPPSAMRSGLMFLLYLLADCRGADNSGVNSLGFAVLVICLVNPFSGGDLGFVSSAVSTLGILLLAEPIQSGLTAPFRGKKLLSKVMAPVLSSLAVTFSALATMLPVLLMAFGGLSLLTPVANLILVFPAMLLLVCGAAGAFLGLLPIAGPAAPFLLCAGWLARFLLWAAEKLAAFPAAYVSFSQPEGLLFLGLLAGLAVVILLMRGDRAAGCAVLAAAVLLVSCGSFLDSRENKVTLAAAADSNCVVLMKDGRAAVLALGGYRTGAAVELLTGSNVRKVEALCLGVRDPDAREAAVQVLETYGTQKLILPEGAYLGKDLALAGKSAELLWVEDGESFTLLDGVTVSTQEKMGLLRLTVNGISVLVETAEGGEGSCQVLVTNRTDSRINSSFTVLQNDDILESENNGVQADRLSELPGGRYLLPDGGGLYVDLAPDGTVSVRGESLCLK